MCVHVMLSTPYRRRHGSQDATSPTYDRGAPVHPFSVLRPRTWDLRFTTSTSVSIPRMSRRHSQRGVGKKNRDDSVDQDVFHCGFG